MSNWAIVFWVAFGYAIGCWRACTHLEDDYNRKMGKCAEILLEKRDD